MAKRTEPDAAATEPTEDPNADVAQLSYEQARDELTAIVDRLEGGQVTLEASVALWQRGEALAAHCSWWLDRARTQVAAVEGD
jgi:exodeoxyribonuclease VII small subunit